MPEPDNLIEAPRSPDMGGAIKDMIEQTIEARPDMTPEDEEFLRGMADDLESGLAHVQEAMEPFIGVFDSRLEAQEKALKEIAAIIEQQERDLKAFEVWAKDTFRREVAESFLEFADLCERHGMHIPEHWRANLQKVAGK